ncbi:ATP-binding protein [Nocardia amikacinitolerans]|uniref:ATP-binding protein n=1 Tax=Nocardia amikacinitolerans TaxID=756689 RepID=UPI0020A5B82D|nr:ATP-binding protein [Nocardia amikacinitolerans]MCP2276838.1 Anti-sigma regulatory factor (Ser/Thr protein kinase) [Nocardia amikacinitolerans]MCP2294781.1 Anti-sigma regulatory factor (Ser/Thr protein kinase) [Nocardia amikacinitolerans]
MTTSRSLRLRTPPRPLELSFPATADRLAQVRHTLQDWLERCGIGAERAYDVLLAVGEACTNAVEHGHRGDGGTVRVRAFYTGAELNVTVSDHGRWKPPDLQARSVRGRGLAIIRAVIPEVDVTTGEGGTTVAMRLPLTA